VAALDRSPFSPPGPSDLGVDRAELRQLVGAGLVVEREGHYFSAQAVAWGARLVAELLAEHPDGITVSMVRDRLQTTRRHAIPFLSLLDAEGVTRRREDVRVAGPRVDSGPVTTHPRSDDEQGAADD
jgi:selenocysteine-specific elongation factor